MLDIKLIREDTAGVKQRLQNKGYAAIEEIEHILELDMKRRTLIAAVESDKAEQNKASKQIPQIKKENGDSTAIIAQMNALKEKIRESEAALNTIEDEYEQLMLGLPNLPDPDLAPGG